MTLGFVAIDKHVSGAVPKSPSPASNDISNVGYYAMEGITGLIFPDGVLAHNPHAQETGALGAESLVGCAGLYAVLQLITGRDRPFQDDHKGYFFQDHDIGGNSFPLGHAMFSWAAASTLPMNIPKVG